MAETRRRIRKRGEKKVDYLEPTPQGEAKRQPKELTPQEELKPKIIKPEPEEEPDRFMTRAQLAKAEQRYEIRKAINEMNADIVDERRLELGEIIEEGLFDGDVSEEYWGFLSRYE